VTDLRVHEVFVIDVIDLLGLDDLALVQKLQSHILSGLFILGHLDLSETTLAQDSSDFVVFKLQLFDGLPFSLLHRIFLNYYTLIEIGFILILRFILLHLSSLIY
jgi:hypothetical protein